MPDKLQLLIQSGHPLVSVETMDEERAVDLVRGVAAGLRRPLFEWSMTTGLRSVDAAGPDRPVVEPGKVGPALEHVRAGAGLTIYLFKDIGPHCKDALVHRTLRDLARLCAATGTTLILVDALPLPNEVRRLTVRYEIGWPTADELEEVVKRTFRRIRDESLEEIKLRISRREMDQLVQSLRGLTCDEAARVVASAIYADLALTADDLSHVVEAKRTLLGSTGCLEAIAVDFAPDDIGGLEALKAWLAQRRGGFTRRARQFGLEPPRGVLMLGVPGCGKSLCAKVVAADWKMPLLRLDPGVLYQKYIGESESQLRQALAQAESMAPVVLWVDEIEKAFASASAASADGGLSKRMFGTLLSWMQDHRHPIFIIATANDVEALPPELMRKGRFDEVFFVDLPAAAVREQILAIHLRRRKRTPEEFDLERLAAAAEEFSGSELEQAVVSALFAAFTDRSELTDAHLLAAIEQTRPLARLMAEKVADLRAWAEERCVSAD
ncbi:MAG TPA: AAA family ATPase [Planctomycetaceae bacterium]|nr:AAA family ATPase [Planctomycetaceae bacterium]